MFFWVRQHNCSLGDPEDSGGNSIDDTGEHYIPGIVVFDIAVDASRVNGETDHAESESPF
jgi:hypothetical protein